MRTTLLSSERKRLFFTTFMVGRWSHPKKPEVQETETGWLKKRPLYHFWKETPNNFQGKIWTKKMKIFVFPQKSSRGHVLAQSSSSQEPCDPQHPINSFTHSLPVKDTFLQFLTLICKAFCCTWKEHFPLSAHVGFYIWGQRQFFL